MTTTSNINIARVLVGGTVAGIIFFIVSGIVNGGILSADFKQWSQEMESHIQPLSQTFALLLWVVMSIVQGIAGMWIYAGIRPRYGAGLKTALLAGFVLWMISKLTTSIDFFALGILPQHIIVGQLIGSFFADLVGIVVGTWLYKE